MKEFKLNLKQKLFNNLIQVFEIESFLYVYELYYRLAKNFKSKKRRLSGITKHGCIQTYLHYNNTND